MIDVEAEPQAAEDVFGDRIDLARVFAKQLAEHGEQRGLIGPLEPPRLWSRHILNSAIAAGAFDAQSRVADIGSGAGLPGIVLAIARPDVSWVLIEPMERRVAWLDEQVGLLGLDNVEVVRARAEDYPAKAGFDAVTARAVSALRTLIPLTAPLVAPGGQLILMKGASVQAEIDAADKQIRRFRISEARVESWGDGVLDQPTTLFRGTVGTAAR
ncbi:Ribosomal RNA small subunit methyltransferase G [Microbacterium sp. C448]|uniref:16S rRNA (guanine(527)-N(7))-methyltransferase RsmG n=1 Tax=Microbacterium sp. C448 TaxID=1177594 RepID=UPI0003DDFBF6|nr:16S rRNA (guanine(527)-N(7))-methyltransferase RsmG [Microbacterium sp. C448]CDK01149.1 Ribosomal RNA small subunit methyltransferase G [Microbacterium sp. C448]